PRMVKCPFFLWSLTLSEKNCELMTSGACWAMVVRSVGGDGQWYGAGGGINRRNSWHYKGCGSVVERGTVGMALAAFVGSKPGVKRAPRTHCGEQHPEALLPASTPVPRAVNGGAGNRPRSEDQSGPDA